MSKSSILLITILTAMLVVTSFTEVEALCGTLGTGKRINKCRQLTEKVKARARALHKTMDFGMERNDPRRV